MAAVSSRIAFCTADFERPLASASWRRLICARRSPERNRTAHSTRSCGRGVRLRTCASATEHARLCGRTARPLNALIPNELFWIYRSAGVGCDVHLTPAEILLARPTCSAFLGICGIAFGSCGRVLRL